MERSDILKRGYLYDKKVGILPKTVDRKRWYILKRGVSGRGGTSSHGIRVVLEIYKDEKAVSKGESPKGLVDIRNVVTVQRVTTKKQTFEILCPGVGYKLMANSDLEVDEWIQAIQHHIVYKRDGYLPSSSSAPALITQDACLRSNSLGRIPGYSSLGPHSQHLGHHMTHVIHQDNRQRTMSDSNRPMSAGGGGPQAHLTYHQQHQQQQQQQHHQYFHGQHSFQSPPILLPSPQRGMVHITHTLPTPPHSASPPSFPSYHFSPGTGTSFLRQRSLESAATSSLASPSTSSDSSSMCSGSNTSFEGGGAGSAGVFEQDGWETKSTFRVQVNEPDSLNLVGPADLMVSDDGLHLLSLPPDQKELVYWPLGCLRKYGNSNHCFTIITGRFCATGEGRFQFFSDESKLIQARLHSFATQKAGRGRNMPRRASEPTDMGTQQMAIPLHNVNPTQSLPPAALMSYSSSPSSPPFAADQNHEYSRLQYMTGHPGSFPNHSMMSRICPHPPQSLPIGAHPTTQSFMPSSSPTRNHVTHHMTQGLPPNPPSSMPDSNLTQDSYNKNKEESRTSSPGSNQSQSNQDQNQTLKTCMSSESSSSAGDSGCASEPPRLSPDHDYEGIPQD